MCEVTDYDITFQIGQTPQIIELFQLKTDDEYKTFLSAIAYLTDKGYIASKLIPMAHGFTQIFMIQLTAYGLDVIETIERNTSLDKYEEDFSATSIFSIAENTSKRNSRSNLYKSRILSIVVCFLNL